MHPKLVFIEVPSLKSHVLRGVCFIHITHDDTSNPVSYRDHVAMEMWSV